MSDTVIKMTASGADSLRRAEKLLAGIKSGAYRASGSALKRAAASAKTQAGRLAAEEYTISKSDFMRATRVKTSVGSTELQVIFAGHVIPLLSFATRINSKGRIETQVMRGGSRTALDHAFAAQVHGHTGVYERKGPDRFPIRGLYGPSSGHMLRNEEVVDRMREQILATYEERLDHEITRILNGWGEHR